MENYSDTQTSQRINRTNAVVYVGLDVHKDTIAVAVAVRELVCGTLVVEDRGMYPNHPVRIAKLAEALSDEFGDALHWVYEAGPCGFVIWRQLQKLGHWCSVIAPTLIPKSAGDRVKTDRRDARQLARLAAGGYLTPIWVPGQAQEALRDLVRLRADMKRLVQKQRQQLNHFLLRHGHRWSKTKWRRQHRVWMKGLKFPQPAQQIALVAALEVLEL